VNLFTSYLKAHLAGLGAALALLIADLNSNVGLTAADWYGIVGAALGVGAVVAVAPNTKTVNAVTPVAVAVTPPVTVDPTTTIPTTVVPPVAQVLGTPVVVDPIASGPQDTVGA
jgi:hypothetical protein